MSFEDLKPNGLYLILLADKLNESHQPESFHWRIYLHKSVMEGEIEHCVDSHMQNTPTGVHYSRSRDIFFSCGVIGLLQIADIPKDEEIESAMHREIQQLSSHIMSSEERVMMSSEKWMFDGNHGVLQLFRKLRVVGRGEGGEKDLKDYPLLECDDLDELKREAQDWGYKNVLIAFESDKPRALKVSKVCGRLD